MQLQYVGRVSLKVVYESLYKIRRSLVPYTSTKNKSSLYVEFQVSPKVSGFRFGESVWFSFHQLIFV